MKVYKCDFCNKIKTCKHKDIEGKEYDICAGCWGGLAKKLKGKGRDKPVEITPWVPYYPIYPPQRWLPEPTLPWTVITWGDTTTGNYTLEGRTTTGGCGSTLAPINTDVLDITLS